MIFSVIRLLRRDCQCVFGCATYNDEVMVFANKSTSTLYCELFVSFSSISSKHKS